MRILIVDDEEGGRYLAAKVLRSAGHDVDTAVDGVDAIEKARESRPDVVLSDVLMPRMDGYQFVRAWKADPDLSGIPVVFHTASYTDPADEKFAHDLGVDGFLSKPVDPRTLLAMLAEVAERGGARSPCCPEQLDEVGVLREYSERLVNKLEEKVSDLERSNSMLGQTMDALSQEVEAKRSLIEDLHDEIAERRKREEELRVERDFTQRIIDTADVFIVMLDRDLRVRLFSPGAERISGWTAEEVLGKSYFDLFVQEDVREERRQAVLSLLKGRELRTHVAPIRTRDDDIRLLEWSDTLTLSGDGTVDGVLAFGNDVTERMRSAAVERAMARIDLAVLLDRPLSEVLDVTCERLVAEFGYRLAFVALRAQDSSSAEIVALSGPLASRFAEITGSVVPAMICPVDRAIDTDEVTVVAAHDVRIDADSLDITALGVESAAAVPLRAHGETVGALGLVADYPRAFEGTRAEALRRVADRVATGILVSEGREQVALQSAALESAGNAIVIADIEGRVKWVNHAFVRLTGITRQEAVGSDLFADAGRAAGSYSEPLYAGAWSAARRGSMYREEFTNERRDGSAYLEDVSFAPVRDERDVVSHVVIVKQDLTERRELEQLKSDFTAVVSHELRTPLTSVIGYADLLARETEGCLDVRAATSLERLLENTRRMQDLVERLLEVTQMQSEGLELDLESCTLASIVREAIERLDPSPGVRIEVVEVGEPVTLLCDRRWISRAVGNLVDNAVKHSPDGERVTVELSLTDAMVTVSVTDRGEGMPAEKIPAVFERFAQLDMSSTRRLGGMGIGLFVAYSVARAHGGIILASSEVGAGSTFTLLLPPGGPGSETSLEGL